jgi:signal transduction histidine kinase
MENLTARIYSAEEIRQTNPADALEMFKEILTTSLNEADYVNSVTAKFNIAITYLILGNYQESLKTFNECLKDTTSLDDKKFRCEILRGIGSNYFRLYNYKEAIKYYYLSEHESVESSNYENLHMLYQDFGALYNRLKMYDKSLEYSLKSLDIAQQCGLNGAKDSVQASLMSIGACYYQLGEMDKALKFLNESLELRSNFFAEANALHFLSIMKFDENNFQEAQHLVTRQIDICRKNNHYDFEALGLRMLGDIKIKENDHTKALDYFNTAVEILEKVGEKQIRFSLKERIIEVYEKTGDMNKVNILYKQLYKDHVDHLDRNIQLKIEQVYGGLETENAKKEIEIEKENNQKLTRVLKEVNGLNSELKILHEEKNSLMGIVAHDLKNPIQSIISSVRIINTDKSDTGNVNELLDNIVNQSRRMDNLISRLLSYAAIKNGQIKFNAASFYTREIFTKLVNANEILALNKEIKIINESPDDNHIVKSDFELLYQVLENLLTNAIKFSPVGKTIYLRTSASPGKFHFEIQDEGPGFTKDDKNKLYSNFAKLSAKPTGNEHSTGLGLSIVKKLCDILEAEIKLESEPGKGAKFIITIVR